MASGRLAKAGRGELVFPLPAGYVRRPSGEVALDPDGQVQAVVRLVFGLFEQLGTVHAVLRFLVEHEVQIGMRERSGPGKGEIVWRAPHQTGLINMLRNPAYAGIYAYGRSRCRGAPQRSGAAGRAGGLRELWPSHAGELREQPAGADRPLLLPAPPSHLRPGALPADGRTVSRRPCRRPGPVGAGPGRTGTVGHRRPAGRGPPGRGRPDLAATPGTRGIPLRPGAAPVSAGRAREPPRG